MKCFNRFAIRIICILQLIGGLSYSQEAYTLAELLDKAVQSHPTAQAKHLLDKLQSLQIKNIQTNFWPQATIQAQATLQNEVSHFPIQLPNIMVQELAKDQYRAITDIQQLIYDGGMISNQKKIVEAQSNVEQAKLEVEQYKIKEKVIQLVVQRHSIQAQLETILLLEKDLQKNHDKVSAQIKSGLMIQAALYQLEVEMIKADQKKTELNNYSKTLSDAISILTYYPILANTKITIPSNVENILDNEDKRPELKWFAAQEQWIAKSKTALFSKKMPKLSAFLQAGYGRPGLNFLSNSFDPILLGGLRTQWSLSPFYTYKKEKEIWSLQSEQIKIQKSSFDLQQNLNKTQFLNEISKLKLLIEQDQKIIELREKIKNTAESQLYSGVLTSAEFVRELNALDQARQMLILHQSQLTGTYILYHNSLSHDFR